MDLREQRFGIEIEMTGITREKAAEVTAEYFGTRTHYVGTYYDTYAAIDSQGRQWKFMSDASITAQKKEDGQRVSAGKEEGWFRQIRSTVPKWSAPSVPTRI